MDSEDNPSIGDTCTQTEQLFRIKHTTKNPNFFVIDKISSEYIANHNKKYHLFLINCDFKKIFNNDFSKPIHTETDFYGNTNPINLKRYLLYHIDDFMEKGHIFSHSDEMNITTVIDKMYKTYDYYIKHPMPAVELKLNKIFTKNPNLRKSLNRSHIHPIIRKFSHIRYSRNLGFMIIIFK